MSRERISQLDFIKCVCIVLMVIFHLVFIGEKYPHAKQFVYAFHMPIFLLISGYLARTDRDVKPFLRSQWWIFVPYLALELPYLILSGMLGVRGGETDLSVPHLAYRIIADPLGPYWYLHTLIICNLSLWATRRLLQRFGWLAQLIVFAGVLALWVYGTGWVSNIVIYYFFGAVISIPGIRFLQVFHPSATSLILIVLFYIVPENLHYITLMGMLLTYMVVNFLLWAYDRIPEQVLQPALFIGRNTLAILLFSPIFTMMAKPLVQILSFDPTGMLFLIIATSVAICGSLGIAWIMDRMKVSRWFCGKSCLLDGNLHNPILGK